MGFYLYILVPVSFLGRLGPTRGEWEESRREDRERRENHTVLSWYVAQGRPYHGSTLIGAPVSSRFKTLRQAQEALIEIRKEYPDAHIIQCRAYV